jgi:ferritin
MLNEKLESAINSQINFELYSSYIYLAMSAHFMSLNLKGFANWMSVQAQEEIIHAMKFYNYVNERGGRVVLQTVKEPPKEWKSPLDAFETAYKHETVVSSRINAIVDLAIVEKDHMSVSFLQWFVNEQVEEEANAKEIADQLRLANDAPQFIFMLDRELGTRAFANPAGANVNIFGLGPAAAAAAP